MALVGEVLFMRHDGASVADAVRHQMAQFATKVDEYDQHRFDRESDAEVVEALVSDLRIEPLSLDRDSAEKNVEEISFAVQDMFSGAVNVPGYRVTKSFRFTGDSDLWNFGTGQWGSTMPYGEVSGVTIRIGMEVRTTDTDRAVYHINSTIEEIEGYLARQRAPLDEYNATLAGRLLPLVEARRNRRGNAQALLDRF